jgi:tetratricopeptide (TPR) repeat protein
MKAVRLIPAAAIAACLALTACSDYVGKEATHPLYAKAMSAKTAKSYRESAESLEEFLTICPKSPKAHYDVALLYKENLENYPAAIYHLLKYLELSGEALSKQDQADIRRYIQDCERLMFESYRIRNDIKLADDVPQADPAKLAAKNAENAALREKLQKYIEHEEAILAQNKELRDRNDRLTRAAAAAATTAASTSTTAARTNAASTGATAAASTSTASRSSIPSSTTGTPGTTIAGENGVRYYYVAKGDGLQAIAQKMYGKASMWNIIQEANKESIGERGILRIGMKLVIPPAQQ